MRKNSGKLDDLYLLGLGIRGLRQLTLETRDVLKKCRVILHIGEDHKGLKKLNPNVVDIASLYWRKEARSKVYKELKKRVVDEIGNGPGVAMVTYGHPLFFDDVNLSLWNHCRRRKLSCTMLPAVSCLDTMSVDLGIDYSDGTQILEATTAVRENAMLCPNMHVMMLQIGEYNWAFTSDALKKHPGHYRSFINYMQKFYPRNHKVQVVYSQDGEDNVLKKKIALHQLDSIREEMFPGTTLYVPPVKQR